MSYPHHNGNRMTAAFGYSLSGLRWNANDLTYSFMPDGTLIWSQASNLQASLANLPTWKNEVRRALACWAAVTPLTFNEVSDDGSPIGSSGPVHGNPKFGDIRIGGITLAGNNLANTYYPYSTTTRGGDMTVNTRYQFKIGANYDLFSVVLHESGHALGLGHSAVSGAVMWRYITGVYTGLTADDIAGIQAIYGTKAN